jgi:hypothetical protein
MGKSGPRYTPEEAEARIPVMLQRIALTAVDIGVQLDSYPIDSQEVETRMLALSGMVGLLNRLCHVVWKSEALKRVAAGSAD